MHNDDIYFAQYVAQRIKELIAPLQPISILDIGCGYGHLTYYLQELFWQSRVVGIDKSPEIIERARQHYPELQFIVADTPAVLPESYELVVVSLVLHHLDAAQQQGMLAALKKIIVPGGNMMIVELNPWHVATRWRVAQDPTERDAMLLSPRYAKTLLARYSKIVIYHYCHAASIVPWFALGGSWLERIPLGEFYIVWVKR